jgi:twitching motility protein PilT
MRVPECEILMPTNAIKNFIRNRDFFKIVSALETGGEHGMWSFQRYRTWLENRTRWNNPEQNPEPPDSEPAEETGMQAVPALAPVAAKVARPERKVEPAPAPGATPAKTAGRIEIEPDESEFGKILKRPGE